MRERDVRRHDTMGELRFAVKGQAYRGSAVVVASGASHGALFAISETGRTWPTHAQTMARILKGFAYVPPGDASGESGAQVPPALPPMQSWRDPNEGAFTLPVPHGWHAQGGLLRPSGIDLRVESVVTSPDEAIQTRLGDAKVPTFGTPYHVPFVGTMPEGTVTAGGTVFWRYLPGDAFLTWAAAELRMRGEVAQAVIAHNVRQTGEIVHGDRLVPPPFDYDRMWRVQ